tara:strand:+ start:136 stop:831 length:696 start_codon:yes stop_codon:yes gene_type:complete
MNASNRIITASDSDEYNPYYTPYYSSFQPYRDPSTEQALHNSFFEKPKYRDVASEEGLQELKDKVFKKSENKDEKEMCTITFEEFTDGEIVSEMPCGHIFNKKAITKWLQEESPCCPICRKKVKSKEISNKITEETRESDTQPDTQADTQEDSDISELPFTSSLLSNDFNDDFYTQQTYHNPNLIENLTNQIMSDLINVNNTDVFTNTIFSTIQSIIDSSNVDASNVSQED